MASYKRETLKLHGQAPDLIPADAPLEAWSAAQNVYFLNGELRRVPGDQAAMGVPPVTPRAVVFYTTAAGEPYWLVVGPGSIQVTDGVNWSNVTPAGGWVAPEGSIFTVASFNGLIVVNCSGLAPVYWPGSPSTICALLPGWDPGWRCMAMRHHKNFLIAIGMLDEAGFQRVRWSDAAEAGQVPGAWVPAADNLAGFFDLVPASSPCIDGFTLRDSFLVLKGESVHSLDYVGGNDVFQNRKLFDSVGIAGANGWAVGPNDQGLFVGSDGDVYVTDGVDYRSILDGKAQQAFYDEIDGETLGKLCGGSIRRLNQSWLGYPQPGEPNATRALLYDWSSGEFGRRDLPQVWCLGEGRLLTEVGLRNSWDGDDEPWDSDQTVWNYALSAATRDDLVGGVDGRLLAMNTGSTFFGGSEVAAFALKQGLAFGNPQVHKLIARVWPKLIGTEGDQVKIRIGGQETSGGAVSWAAQVAYTIGEGRAVDAFANGRFIALEIASAGGDPWALGTVDVEYREVGAW